MIDRKQYEEALYNTLLFLPGKGEEKSQQVTGANVSKYHYRVVFKPSTIVPDINVR